MKNVLHVPYLTTVVLQKNDFTLSDFFGCLQIIDIKLKQIIESPQRKATQLAQKLQQCINSRKPKLLDTPLMMCALFLDPRYKCAIDSDYEKIQLAKMTLEHLWERLKSVKNSASRELLVEAPIVNTTSEDNMESFYAELDLHFNESMGLQASLAGSAHSTDSSHDKNSFNNAISKYESSVLGFRMKSNESIHSFWESKKEEFGNELYELACVIFAIPPTQASVERSFSALKYTLTDRRYNLKPELLEALLLIHLNRDFFYLVKEEDIQNEKKKT